MEPEGCVIMNIISRLPAIITPVLKPAWLFLIFLIYHEVRLTLEYCRSDRARVHCCEYGLYQPLSG